MQYRSLLVLAIATICHFANNSAEAIDRQLTVLSLDKQMIKTALAIEDAGYGTVLEFSADLRDPSLGLFDPTIYAQVMSSPTPQPAILYEGAGGEQQLALVGLDRCKGWGLQCHDSSCGNIIWQGTCVNLVVVPCFCAVGTRSRAYSMD